MNFFEWRETYYRNDGYLIDKRNFRIGDGPITEMVLIQLISGLFLWRGTFFRNGGYSINRIFFGGGTYDRNVGY